MDSLPTPGELERLPRWARVAFAVRCAQRVFPLFERWAKKKKSWSEDLAKTIRLASNYDNDALALTGDTFHAAADYADDARVADADDATAAAAYAALAAANAAAHTDADHADAAHADAAAAQADAAYAGNADDKSGHRLIRRAIRRDLGVLLTLIDRAPQTRSEPVDPKALGTLWPDGAPEWYYDSDLLKDVLPSRGESSITVKSQKFPFVRVFVPAMKGKQPPALELHFEPGSASEESVRRVMEALSKLHIAAGGAGLEFQPDDGFVHAREVVEA